MSELGDFADHERENYNELVQEAHLRSVSFQDLEILEENTFGKNNGSIQDNPCGFSEKKLANGDIYVGSWKSGLPDGPGKYLWSDGCMYEGEWVSGKKTGGGKISWPSGATYEGEFSGGCIQGIGTFTGASNTTYKGSWIMNVEHGLGRKHYSNGDVYEGLWKQGMPDGQGRYTWKKGNVYFGDWKAGIIYGHGSFMWVNRDVYKGQWKNGLKQGHGIYQWADGSCYIGTWSRGLKDGRGTFYPPGTLPSENLTLASCDIGSREVTRNSKSFSHREHSLVVLSHKHSRTSSFEKVSIASLRKSESLPSRCVVIQNPWSSDGSSDGMPFFNSEMGMVRGCSECGDGPMAANALPIERQYAQGVLISEVAKDSPQSISLKNALYRQGHQAKDVKRPGEAIIKGHRSYDLMLNLQLGISYSVGRSIQGSMIDSESLDFNPRARIRIKFPKKGSQLTPSHQSVDFEWRDYCPLVFRNLRKIFKIEAADYIMSICGNDALRELSSPGKSGSVFYLSSDDRFMIKTLRKSEVKVLLKMLPHYYAHLCKHADTLITKFFGLHQVTPAGGQKIRVVVMGNVFCTKLRVHRRFDLKGSSQGRSANKVEIDETTTLKDLDLDFIFLLERSWRQALLEQIKKDCSFLESQQIMDYSLLLGLHFRAPQHLDIVDAQLSEREISSLNDTEIQSIKDWTHPADFVIVPHEPSEGSSLGPHVRGSPLRAEASGHEEVDLMLPATNSRLQIQLGFNMPARADRRPHPCDGAQCAEDFFSEVYDVIVYFGIIDVLQKYNFRKRVEHAYKSVKFSSDSISSVNPHFYSQRFQEFICKTFPPNL